MVCDGFQDESEYGFDGREYTHRRLALVKETIVSKAVISKSWRNRTRDTHLIYQPEVAPKGAFTITASIESICPSTILNNSASNRDRGL